MYFNEKLKECRKQVGLSQEELAEKLCVSRQAITKWENGRGMPNIESLQSIAKIFNVSIDYLLEDKVTLTNTVIKESISIDEYEIKGKCRSKYDAVVQSKYPNAKTITPLLRRKKLNNIEKVIDFFVSPGVLQTTDALSNKDAYYLVELDNVHLLVQVTNDYIEIKELTIKFIEKKKIIGNNIFIKANYTL